MPLEPSNRLTIIWTSILVVTFGTKFVMPQAPKQFSVLGMPIHLLENYPHWLVSRLTEKQGTHIVTLNAEMTMEARINPQLAEVIRQADLIIPDGAGVVLYLKLHGFRVRRCPGIELAENLLQESVEPEHPWPVFFYGGAPGVAQAAAETWQQRIPGLAIVGTQHGYHTLEEEETIRQALKETQPRLIMVGLGVPRQEYWIRQHRQVCPQAIWIGVGGSFDIWAGLKSRAPDWLKDNHLEWTYRLYKEPWRWRRMLALPRFALYALVERLAKNVITRHQTS